MIRFLAAFLLVFATGPAFAQDLTPAETEATGEAAPAAEAEAEEAPAAEAEAGEEKADEA